MATIREREREDWCVSRMLTHQFRPLINNTRARMWGMRRRRPHPRPPRAPSKLTQRKIRFPIYPCARQHTQPTNQPLPHTHYSSSSSSSSKIFITGPGLDRLLRRKHGRAHSIYIYTYSLREMRPIGEKHPREREREKNYRAFLAATSLCYFEWKINVSD